MNLQQALMARLGQAAAAASILNEKQHQHSQQQQNHQQNHQQTNFSMHGNQMQLPNNKILHLMPGYGNLSSPGKWYNLKKMNWLEDFEFRVRNELRL